MFAIIMLTSSVCYSVVHVSQQDSVKASRDASDKTLKELVAFMETKCSELKELIKAREQANLSEADQLEGRLETFLETLKQKNDELDQLSLTEDPIHFLQVMLPSSSSPPL